jgi:3',5'-cyclic AMP phosphodiesterase CpdA
MSAATDSPAPPALRLAHFSDIHVTAPACVWRPEDWFNKRMSAWLNLRLLRRGARFRHADRVVAALSAELHSRGFHHAVFSGDATALGFEEEVARAAYLLGLGRPGCLPGLAVPGNHDYTTYHSMRSGHFERHFAPWLAGERVDGEAYPFAQRAGHAWLVGVNSSTANRWAWDASGRVGGPQLERLEKLLARLDGGPRILVTHYPVWLAAGGRERRAHGLRDLDDLVAVARRGGVGLWLHGHRHHAYHHTATEFAGFPVICAGSATQRGLWSYSDYTLTGRRLRAVARVYDLEREGFRDGVAFELELPASPEASGTGACAGGGPGRRSHA